MRDDIDTLARLFSEFPGTGERQSRRFVYALLNKPQDYLDSLSESIKRLKQKISQCNSCFRFFPRDGYDLCPECSSPHTDKSTLLILEKNSDFETVRRSKLYKGRYFILGGLVPIIDKTTTQKIRVNELITEVEKQAKNGLKEIIIALSLTPQGENTERHLKEMLEPLASTFSLTISSLGRGLSTGSELEYSDDETLKYALTNRK